MWPIVIASLVVAGIVGALMLARMMVGRLRATGNARMQTLLQGRAPRLVDDMANFFGLQSIGAVQARGNGCLALTDDELVFAQWVPERTFRVRLADVVAVEQTRSHLGKSIFRPLLLVRWRVAGVDESAAWFVRDLSAWQSALHAHARAVPTSTNA